MELEIWGLHEKKADDVKHHLFFLKKSQVKDYDPLEHIQNW